jgi:hypothetical protein
MVMGLSRIARVTEDTEKYYVQINYDDRFRAKSIPGRTWDHNIKKWVWSKSVENYISLQNEFKDDEFLISPPTQEVASINDAYDLPENIFLAEMAAIRETDFNDPDSVGVLNEKTQSLNQRRRNTKIKELFSDTKFKDSLSDIKTVDDAKIRIANLTLDLAETKGHLIDYYKTLKENDGLIDMIEHKDWEIKKKEQHLESLKQQQQQHAIELVSQAFDQATKSIEFKQQRIVQIALKTFSDDPLLVESLDTGSLHMFCTRLHNTVYEKSRSLLVDYLDRSRTEIEVKQLNEILKQNQKMRSVFDDIREHRKKDPELKTLTEHEIEKVWFELIPMSNESRNNISFLRRTRNQVQHLKPSLSSERYFDSTREELLLVSYLAVACQVWKMLNDLSESNDGDQ